MECCQELFRRWNVAWRRYVWRVFQRIADLINSLQELSPDFNELVGFRVLTPGHGEHHFQHVVGMPDEIDQVLTARATDPSKPVLDRPLARPSPSPDDFDGLMGGAQLAFQSIGDGRGYGPRFSSFGKTMPFFGNILPTLRSYSELAMRI